MTKNKRFIMEESEGQDTIYDNEGLDDYYHLGNDTRDVKALCNLLNEQEETIQDLKCRINSIYAILREEKCSDDGMTEIPYCKNCKHLSTDGMFGLICDVCGNNKKYDCPKYEKTEKVTFEEEIRKIADILNIINGVTNKDNNNKITEKRFTHEKWYDERKIKENGELFAIVDVYNQADKICNRLNELFDENEQLKERIKVLEDANAGLVGTIAHFDIEEVL